MEAYALLSRSTKVNGGLRPLAVHHALDGVGGGPPRIETFVTGYEVLGRDHASRRNAEYGGFVGRPGALARHQVPERNAVVIGTDVQRIGGSRFRICQGHFGAVALIYRGGVRAVPGIGFVDGVSVGFADLRPGGEIRAIDHDAQRGGIDDVLRVERDRVLEVALGAGRQHKTHFAIRAGHRHVRRRGERQTENNQWIQDKCLHLRSPWAGHAANLPCDLPRLILTRFIEPGPAGWRHRRPAQVPTSKPFGRATRPPRSTMPAASRLLPGRRAVADP